MTGYGQTRDTKTQIEEHYSNGTDFAKKVLCFGRDSSGTLNDIYVDSNGSSLVRYSDSQSLDAFGRIRTSSPYTLFDSKQLFDNQPLFWDDSEVSGGSTTSSHSTATASTTIGVGATTAGKRVRQTFMSFNYQPGKS